jgi:hypothetical protein
MTGKQLVAKNYLADVEIDRSPASIPQASHGGSLRQEQGQVMSGRRRGKALIQLMYFVLRAWLALTTPCLAQTQAGLGSERPESASRADGGISGDHLNLVAVPVTAKIYLCRCRSAS